MLLDMIYTKPSKQTDWKDYLVVLYRDLITNKKEKMIIEEPTINIFTVKEEYRRFRKPRHFLSRDMLEMKTVKYKNVVREIAKIAGQQWLDYYNNHPSFKDRKQIFKYPYVLGGDIDIVTYYMTIWNEECGNNERKSPNKIFLDIEVDQIDYEGAIARHGECEVNAVTVIDDISSTSYTFLLDNGNNPQIKDFINNQDAFQTKLHEMFDESYGDITYNIYMFTDEREMLTQLFKLIHTLDRDMCLIWNMSFDIPYLIDRMNELGMNAKDVMCSKDFPSQSLYYFEDKRTFEFANKKDYFAITDRTHYIDQLISYAALRKSQGAVKKVNLGAVAQKELKDTKLDYSDVGNIRTLPYEDYEKFVIYNIKDVLLQMGLERKNHDMDNLYLISTSNNISYTDATKQTVTFRGLMYSDLKRDGIVLGHNVNFDQGGSKYDENGELNPKDDDDDDDSFAGAINGDPMLNLPNGIEMYGSKSMFLYGLVIDFDFSAMYPSSIIAFNIFATTMIGKVIITTVELEHPYDEDLGKEYIEDLIQNDPEFIGHKWHKLSDYETLILRLQEKFNVH